MEIDEIRTLCGKYMDGETTLAEEALLRGWFTSVPEDGIPEDIRDMAGMFSYFDEKRALVSPLRSVNWQLITAISGSVAAAVVAGLFLLTSWSSPFSMKVDGVKVNDEAQAIEFANSRLQKVAQMMDGLNKAEDKINVSGKRILNITECINEN